MEKYFDGEGHRTVDDYVLKFCSDLKKKLLQVIQLFPKDCNWGIRGVDVAINKIIQYPKKTPEQIIDDIKRSYLGNNQEWYVDREQGELLLTQDKIDFNEKVKKRA